MVLGMSAMQMRRCRKHWKFVVGLRRWLPLLVNMLLRQRSRLSLRSPLALGICRLTGGRTTLRHAEESLLDVGGTKPPGAKSQSQSGA